jgi:hypothetical protein
MRYNRARDAPANCLLSPTVYRQTARLVRTLPVFYV